MSAEEDANDPRALEPGRSDRRWPPRGVAWLLGGLVLGAVVVAVTGAALRGSPGGTAIATTSPGVVPAIADVRDDLFALSMRSPTQRYAVNELIALETTLRYVGAPEHMTVTGSGSGIVGFTIEQLDGPVDIGGARTGDCKRYEFQRGQVDQIRFQKSGGFSADDPMAPFWRAFFRDPQLRLPTGTYRVTAEALHGAPECGQERRLAASILIVVE
jgi:hypothetical protein